MCHPGSLDGSESIDHPAKNKDLEASFLLANWTSNMEIIFMLIEIIESSADIIGYRYETDLSDCSDVSMLY